jgi:hypothetical protein
VSRSGYGATFAISDGAGDYIAVGEVREITPPSTSRDGPEATSHGSTERFQEYLAGLRDGGEVSLKLNYTTAGYAALITEWNREVSWDYLITLPDGATHSFSGFVTGLVVTSPVEDVYEIAVAFKATRAVDYDTAPPPPPPPPPAMPDTPFAWFYMWEGAESGAYVPDHLATPYTPLRNVYGAVELRSDSSATNPTVTRNAADGPLGVNTAATMVFSATTSTFQIVGSTTFDLESLVSYEIEVSMVTVSGTGAKNYRIGQTGTNGTHYTTVSVPDESSTSFTTPGTAACTFNFTFTNDTAKVVQILPDTNGDAATLKVGYIRIRKASDAAFVALASQRWGDVLSRGTRTTGGVVMDGLGYNMLGAGGASDGLIGRYSTAPLQKTFTSGTTRIALAKVNGGAGTGTPAIILANDSDGGLSAANSIGTGALGVDLSGQEGYLYVQPDHSVTDHGVNLIGKGYVAIWQVIEDGAHEFGVDKYPLYLRTDALSFPQAYSGFRVGSYPATRLITGTSFRNDMEVAAAIIYDRALTQAEIFEAVEALYYDFEAEGGTLGSREIVGVVGDSNDVRATGDWTYLISANGYMSPGENVWLNLQAVGGRGVYDGTVGAFNVDMDPGGFVPQINYIIPSLENAVADGHPAAVAIRGYTNDAPFVALDRQRVWDDYVDLIYDPVLATGAHLLLMDVLPCANRFTEANNLWLRDQMAAYAAAHPGQVWHFASGNTGMFDVDDTVNVTGAGGATATGTVDTTYYLKPDYVHLTAAGDALLASHYKTLIETWRDER